MKAKITDHGAPGGEHGGDQDHDTEDRDTGVKSLGAAQRNCGTNRVARNVPQGQRGEGQGDV